MKKIFLFISLVISLTVFFACDKTKTAQEKYEEEKKSISRFISRNGFDIEDKDTARMYEENVYFKTKDGLYIHVIDSGNGNKAKANQIVTARYRDMVFFKSDTTKYTNEYSKDPDLFYFGNSSTYIGYACDGWALALSLVSENAEVSLIIPSILQPSSMQSYYEPMYIGRIKFRYSN